MRNGACLLHLSSVFLSRRSGRASGETTRQAGINTRASRSIYTSRHKPMACFGWHGMTSGCSLLFCPHLRSPSLPPSICPSAHPFSSKANSLDMIFLSLVSLPLYRPACFLLLFASAPSSRCLTLFCHNPPPPTYSSCPSLPYSQGAV